MQHALIKAKLEPYLGFLQSNAKGKPSLICDFQELHRYVIDDFVIEYCRKLRKEDFAIKTEGFSTKRKGKREYVNDLKTYDSVNRLNEYFQRKVKVPRIRMGDKQELETLINEEASSLAMFLRNERQSWKPRISELY